MTKLVFFDLDGTLIDGPSSEIQFFLFLLQKCYFGFRQALASFVFIGRWFGHFKKEVFVKDKAYLNGLPVSDITSLATQFTQQRLLPSVRAHIKQRLDEHLRNKDIVILLTGSPDFIASVFAEHFGISELYATKFVLNANNDRFSEEPPTQHPYALEKLKIAKVVCDKYKMPISETIAYANSIHDYALLNACGVPIVVTPDRKLRRVAAAKNWTVID